MTEAKIREIAYRFALEAKKIYGDKLDKVILYGSCARGDFADDSDIDILLLLDVPREDITIERRKIFDIADEMDLEYDVVLAPVLQSLSVYRDYLEVSGFYQNIQKEGVQIA